MMGIVSAVLSILGGPVCGLVYGSVIVEQMDAHPSQPRKQAVRDDSKPTVTMTWVQYTPIL